MIELAEQTTLTDIYRRERLSFLQYIRQTSPYASAADRPLLERVRELGKSESATLDGLAEFLDENRVAPPQVGAFPTPFTNYNFVAIRKLLPTIVEDEARGLASMEHELCTMAPGDGRKWVEKLAESKRMHVTELIKLAQ